MLPGEWQEHVRKHGGSESRAKRELGTEPVLVPDETTRAYAEEMFNNPAPSLLRTTVAEVWDKIFECNGGTPAILTDFPVVVCADWMTYDALAGKNPLITRFGCGLTGEEHRDLEDEAAAEDARRSAE